MELTQAEYDALSDERKNDGTIYFITDGDGEVGINDGIISDTSTYSSNQIESKLTEKQDNLKIYRSHTLSGDLNDLTESGFYSVGDAAQWENIPEDKYGTLLVMASHLYTVQMFIRTNTDGTGFFHVRMKTEDTWGAWVKLF